MFDVILAIHKNMTTTSGTHPRLWYDPYHLHARDLGLCLFSFFLVSWSVICYQETNGRVLGY